MNYKFVMQSDYTRGWTPSSLNIGNSMHDDNFLMTESERETLHPLPILHDVCVCLCHSLSVSFFDESLCDLVKWPSWPQRL
jgi:hypothetical protein